MEQALVVEQPVTESGIYCILNSANSKVYIGSTINLKKRKWTHFRDLQKGVHKNLHLQKAFNKYGKEDFSFHILECSSHDRLTAAEQFWMDIFSIDEKYNIAPVAGNTLGYKHTPAALAKISARSHGERNPNYGKTGEKSFHFGRKRSPITCKKISCAIKGRIFTPEWRAKISASRRGKPVSSETRSKLSAAAIGRPVSAATRLKIGNSNRGKEIPAETRLAISIAHRGKKLSLSHRRNMSIAQRARWRHIKQSQEVLHDN